MATPSAVWDRLPLPPEHAVGMLAGLALNRLAPRHRLPTYLCRTGWLLLAAAARGGEVIEQPEHLVVDGPQAWTRNPMYVGWTMLHLGTGLVVGSPWMLATWPISLALIHRQVLHEER